jgi:hypothetical protein
LVVILNIIRRLSRLEKQLLAKPWQEARVGVAVKLLADDGELYVFAESIERVSKERAMRRRHPTQGVSSVNAVSFPS